MIWIFWELLHNLGAFPHHIYILEKYNNKRMNNLQNSGGGNSSKDQAIKKEFKSRKSCIALLGSTISFIFLIYTTVILNSIGMIIWGTVLILCLRVLFGESGKIIEIKIKN